MISLKNKERRERYKDCEKRKQTIIICRLYNCECGKLKKIYTKKSLESIRALNTIIGYKNNIQNHLPFYIPATNN